MDSRIARLEQTIQGALGVFLFDGIIFCFTLHPDITDLHFQIPANTPDHPIYICTRYKSPTHGDTFIISRPETPGLVDGHDYIEFHAGNTEDDTKACTVLGETTGKLKGNRAVLNSGATFKRWLDYTKGVDEFPLEIIDLYMER
jgi:hypothetical protein